MRSAAFSPAILCAIALLPSLLAGCGAVNRGVATRPEVLEIGDGVPGKYVSLAAVDTTLFAVFSDRESTTLKTLQVPIGPHLPAGLPAATVLDKIDVTPPLSPSFGEHVLAASGSRIEVMYASRHNEDHSILKIAWRESADSQWRLDIIEPPGDPVALLGGSSPVLFWASGALYRRAQASPDPAVALPQPFQLRGRASTFSPDGFTVFDGASGTLMAVTLAPEGVRVRPVPGASEIHSSLLNSDGRLAVLSWDAKSRRLLLFEEKPRNTEVAGGTEFNRTTVTLCDGTGTAIVLPPHRRGGFLFLFDEIRRAGAGSTDHQLSLLAPARLIGGLGSRYEKSVVLSGPEPIEGFAASETPDALYILAVQGTLKLIRVGLQP